MAEDAAAAAMQAAGQDGGFREIPVLPTAILEAAFVRGALGFCMALTAAAWWWNRRAAALAGKQKRERHFRDFQRTYLWVYLTAMMADWLQGPAVYALYQSYGIEQGDNAILFTVGFGSSAVFGTIVGSLADRLGRRRFAAVYCISYVASCLTKHVNNFYCLVVGRVTGGIGTSLLFSVFETWMVSEHNCRNYEPDLLSSTFTKAVFSNGLIAIAAGVLAQLAADFVDLTPLGEQSIVNYGGWSAPFDLAILFLILSLSLIATTWSENYGQQTTQSMSLLQTMRPAMRTVLSVPEVLYCGIVCASFEASMFIFVFMWTPALTNDEDRHPPYGWIFASFMAMSMLGSQIFAIESRRRPIEEIGKWTMGLAALSHAVPVVTSDVTQRFVSFLVFEMCVGLYFPMMGTLKGTIVPEECRSSIYNLYRVPLNVLVVAVLSLDLRTAFLLTTVLLGAALYFQWGLANMLGKNIQYRSVSTKADPDFALDDEAATVLGSKSDATGVS